MFQLSQDGAATLIRWGGWSVYRHTCRSFFDPKWKRHWYPL